MSSLDLLTLPVSAGVKETIGFWLGKFQLCLGVVVARLGVSSQSFLDVDTH